MKRNLDDEIVILENERWQKVKALIKGAVVEKALEEFIRRRRARRILELEGKLELAFGVDELVRRRRKDVPHR